MIRRAALLIVVASLAVPSPALAQAEVLMIGLCKKITEEAARLKCFDAIGTETGKKDDPKPPIPTKQEWQLVENKSPIDDSPQISAGLLSDEGTSGMILRCAEHKTEAIVMPNGLFAHQTGTVVLRLNDLPAVSAVWNASSNNQALFAPNGITFVKMLPDDGTLFVRSKGHSRFADDATFKLGKVSSVREKISAACKWDVAAKPKSGSSQK